MNAVKKSWWFWLAIPFLIINGFFVANLRVRPELKPFADRPEIAVVSSLFVLVFAAPSFIALVKWLGNRGVFALVSLGVYAVAIESFAVVTGFPYGHFAYGEKIGGKIFDLVPWTVCFAWTPVLLGAFCLARRLVRDRIGHNFWTRLPLKTVLATALIATAFDLVLDPGAVSQGFWTYRDGGIFYGVPLSNFVGWILSGAVGALILHHFAQWHARDLPPRGLLGSAWLLTLFWTSVCAFSSLWIATAIGVALLAIIVGVCCARQ